MVKILEMEAPAVTPRPPRDPAPMGKESPNKNELPRARAARPQFSDGEVQDLIDAVDTFMKAYRAAAKRSDKVRRQVARMGNLLEKLEGG